MGTVERFPLERVSYSLEPIGGNRGATILVLPVVRIERDDDLLLAEDTYAAMARSFDLLHEAIRGKPPTA